MYLFSKPRLTNSDNSETFSFEFHIQRFGVTRLRKIPLLAWNIKLQSGSQRVKAAKSKLSNLSKQLTMLLNICFFCMAESEEA